MCAFAFCIKCIQKVTTLILYVRETQPNRRKNQQFYVELPRKVDVSSVVFSHSSLQCGTIFQQKNEDFGIKGIVSRDFVICFLVSFDRSDISTHQEWVLLLSKVRFCIEFFDFRVWAW
jgi:hypothetical protein